MARWRKTEKFETRQKPFVSGVEESPVDIRDFDAPLLTAVEAPSRYTLSWALPSTKNQGRIGSCGSHAFASAMEAMLSMRDSALAIELSERFHYYVVRSSDFMGTLPRDSGQYLRDGCKVLHKVGIAPEALCPYIVGDYNKKPSPFAFGFSRFFKIRGYYKCTSIEQMKAEIYKDHPIVFGVHVFPSFLSNKNSKYGLSSMGKNERTAGGHAMLIVGYDNALKSFLVLNSWGPNWGRAGKVWLSYEYVQKYLIEAWGITL